MKKLFTQIKSELIIFRSRFQNNALRHFIKELIKKEDKSEYLNLIAKQYGLYNLTNALSSKVNEKTYNYRSLLSCKVLRKLLKENKGTELYAKEYICNTIAENHNKWLHELVLDLDYLVEYYGYSYIKEQKPNSFNAVKLLEFLKLNLFYINGNKAVKINNILITEYQQELKCKIIDRDLKKIENSRDLLTQKNITNIVNACIKLNYNKHNTKLKELFDKMQSTDVKTFNQHLKFITN